MKRKDYLAGFLLGFFIPTLFIGLIVKNLFIPQDIVLNDLELVDFQNKPIDKASFKDKNVLINFWATWCRPCIEEIPTFEQLDKNLDKDNWVLLLANDESNRRQEAFFKKRKYDVVFIKSNTKFSDLGIMSIPRTYIWDKSGELVYKVIGKIEGKTEEKLMEKIEELN